MTLTDQILGWGTAAGLVTGLVLGVIKYRQIGRPTGAADAYFNDADLNESRANAETSLNNFRAKGSLDPRPKV